jgi:hypothetical protein
MAETRHLEFFLLRYVPDAVKNEFVNIGVVAFEPQPTDGKGLVEVRLTRDWRRVRCMDPEADIEVLQALEAGLRRDLAGMDDRRVLLPKLREMCSNLVQMSETKGVITENPVKEVETLVSLYCDRAHTSGPRPASGRQAILNQMEAAFRQEGVLELLLKNISAAPYTRTGDPMKFDFGYPKGMELKLLQAVSLRASVQPAVVLASRFPAIAERIEKKNGAAARLTAVVDDELAMDDEIEFALGMMQENGIAIARAAEMEAVAGRVRVELGSGRP